MRVSSIPSKSPVYVNRRVSSARTPCGGFSGGVRSAPGAVPATAARNAESTRNRADCSGSTGLSSGRKSGLHTAMKFEILASGYGLVEGPTEDPQGRIVFSDVLGGGVYGVDRGGAVTTLVPKRRGVGGIALHAAGGVVCSGRDIAHVRENTTRTLFGIPGLPGWNDLC